MCDFENVHTERLVIRRLVMADKDALFAYRSMPEVCQYQSWQPKHIEQVETFIVGIATVVPNTPNTWMQLALCLPEGKLIGDIGIHFLEDGAQVEIGYTLNSSFQGNGYAAEAVCAILDYLFDKLGKHRVIASVDPDNLRSVLLLQRLGFRLEANFIKSIWTNDHWLDDCVYAMLEEEWITRKPEQ